MKLNVLLAALFVAGLAASIALASPGNGNAPATSGTDTTATTTTGESGGHGMGGKHDDGDKAKKKADKPHCQEVELKGTLANGTLSLSVDKANKAGRTLGSTVSVAYGGKVKLHARLCQAAGTGAATTATGTLQLRDLKVQGKDDSGTTTTGTTTTTTTTG